MTRSPSSNPPAARRRPLARIGLAGALLAVGAAPVQDAGPSPEDARAVLQELIETRRVISDEKRDWAIAREVLQDRVALVQDEIAGLRQRIAEAESSIGEADVKRAELLADHGRLEAAVTGLVPVVESLEARLRELLPRLPAPLLERVKPLAQRLPEDPATTKLGIGERCMPIAGVLNEIDKFNREIAVASEVRTLDDGTALEVTAFYVGLGQAYYVSADGTKAGVGRPGQAGWEWAPIDADAAQVARAVAMLRNEEVAAFVQLPLAVE